MRLAILGALLTALAGCDDTLFGKPLSGEGEGEGEGETGDTGGSDEGWCAVQSIFNSACVSCHTAGGGSGDLDLVTDPYAATVGHASAGNPGEILVIPGDSAGSLLYRKVSGTQASDEFGVMPLGSGLDATRTAVIKAWIDAGASSDCSDTGIDTDTAVERHHPEGYAEGEVHGLDAKYQTEQCTTCHGEDLTGGDVGVSCDSCHEGGTAWRTDCTFCHGGTDGTSTGAPPRGLSGETDESLLSFVAHTTHVNATDVKVAYDCDTCHTKPSDEENVLFDGHIFVNTVEDTTKGVAEMNFSAGRSPAAEWDGSVGTCTNLYCHGNGQGNNGEASNGDDFSDCASCHPWQYSSVSSWETMTGRHAFHLDEVTGVECGDCHKQVVDRWEPILDTSLHVNGVPDITLVGGMSWNSSAETCDGECHYEEHDNRWWYDDDDYFMPFAVR